MFYKKCYIKQTKNIKYYAKEMYLWEENGRY